VDIRTKLIFALVAVALASMFALGAVVSPRVGGFLRDDTLEQLDELAESRRQALLWILGGWRDRTSLIASSTELRAGLDERRRTGSAAALDRVQMILGNAMGAAGTVALLRVHDLDGALVAAVSSGPTATLPSRDVSPSPLPPSDVVYAGVEFDGSGSPQVTLAAPIAWEGEAVGTLVAVFAARELLELAATYNGLGETGETLVFVEDADGVPRTLHPTRHGDAVGGVALPDGPGSLAIRAFGGESTPVADGVIDYRGEPVWAATRFVPETGWGLVVKLDAAEQERRYVEFRDWLQRTALILSAFAILAGFVLGLRFALPIHALAQAANRIRGGDMQARAKITGEDEVGLLARNFNGMVDELEERVTLLREFRKFFDVSIDLMCIAGTDGYFRRTNLAFQKTLGWTEEELLARPFFDFVHPEDVAKTEREVAKLAGGVPTISFENRYLCKDGSYRVLRWTSYPESGVLYAIARVIGDPSPA